MNEPGFLRWLVIINGGVPLIMLLNDAARHHLGANAVNNALHVTGILSLVFLFLSLLMTPLRWFSGWGGWVALRRALGLYGFFYAVIHLVIYIYWDRAGSLPGTLREIWMRRFLQVGIVALVLMIPLAVTSTNSMIRRVGPVRWKQLHRLSYLVAVLGVLHYFMLVKSDIRQPLAFAGVLTVVLGSRFGRSRFERLRKTTNSPRSKRQMVTTGSTLNSTQTLKPPAQETAANDEPTAKGRQWKGQLRVISVVQETPDVRTFRLAHPDGNQLPFNFAAGQFLNLQLMIDDRRVNRSYTLASSPLCREHCELTIKRESLGLASRYLHESMNLRDLLSVSGPAGKFVFNDVNMPGVVLIAGGVGITPVMSILRTLAQQNWDKPIYFLFAAKTEADLIFRSELQAIAEQQPQVRLLLTLTREPSGSSWNGLRGRIDSAMLTQFVPGLLELPVFLCGPHEMIDGLRDTLHKLGIASDMIRTEVFSGRKGKPSDGEAFETSIISTQPISTAQVSKTDFQIQFARSQQASTCKPDESVLEAAERIGIEIPYECRSGICGQCKVKVLSGTVRMNCEDALSRTEKSDGIVLTCQAQPTSDMVVEI